MSTKLFLVILLTVFSTSSAHGEAPSNASNETVPVSGGQATSAADKWLAADRTLRDFSAMAVKAILPRALKATESLNLTAGCSRDLFKFLMGVRKTKLWAYKMLDSFGKIPNGIFSGNINTLGDYDQCVGTDIPGGVSRGQYCTVDVAPPLPQPRERFVSFSVVIPEFVNITPSDSVLSVSRTQDLPDADYLCSEKDCCAEMGLSEYVLQHARAITELMKLARTFYHLRFRTSVCIPSTCTKNDLGQIIGNVLETMKLDFTVTIPNCETKVDKVVFSTLEISIMTLLSLLLLVAIVATIKDITLQLTRSKEDKDKIGVSTKCLLCFSLSKNLERLLKKDDSEDSIKIFHGLKVITMLWIMFGHMYIFVNYQAMSDLVKVKTMTEEFLFTVVSNGLPSVQPFFYISAVLTAFGVMKMKGKNINIFLFILRRIWRLAPPFMLVIACVFLIPHLGSGPVWKETIVDQLTERCRINWWTNLVFINNFVPLQNMCLRWMWYIPVDFQLYVISLVVLVPLKRNARWGLIVNLALFCVSIIVSAVLHVRYKLHPTLIPMHDHPDDIGYELEYGYHRTYLHIGTYCIGLTVGYILATKPKIHIPVWVNAVGWIAAWALGLGVVYGVWDSIMGHMPSVPVSTLYATTNRFLFTLAFAWLTISCLNGRGGIINSFLSWPAFVPLSRLTYMTYLVHPLVIHMFVGSTRTVIRHDHRTMVVHYLATVLMSYMVVLPLGLLFESPCLALEKVLMSRGRSGGDHKSRDKGQGDHNYNDTGRELNGKDNFAMTMK